MMPDPPLDPYVDLAVRERVFSGKDAVRSRMRFLFGGLELSGKRVLTIEPAGWYALYAGCRGAAEAVWIDPHARRAQSTAARLFEERRGHLRLQTVVRPDPASFPDCDFDAPFDAILLDDAICRFDERACATLSRNLGAVKKYKRFLKRLAHAAGPGATLIISDHSRYNLFPFFHLANPFARRVDWKIRQAPSLWASLLMQVGFTDARIRWFSPGGEGALGEKIFDNAFGAYFYKSRFCLTMSKSDRR